MELGEEDVEGERARWEAARERRGLPVGENEDVGGSSVRGQVGTPVVRRNGKGKAIEGGTPDLARSLRKSTAKKYDPFAAGLDGFGLSGTGGTPTLMAKGRIKNPIAVLSLLGRASIAEKEKAMSPSIGLGNGLLAGYSSD